MNTEKMDNPVLRIMSIFNLLRMNALTLSGQAKGELEEFCLDVASVSEIGLDEANKIWKEDSGGGEAEIKTLATQIVALLASDEIPDELHDAIMDGLDNLGAITRHKTLTRVEKSADYIASVLRDYKEIREAGDE